MNKILLGILLLSSILIVGCAKEQVIGGDKDEHGCLIAAGYSWCDVKQKCLRTWEENCSESVAIVPTDIPNDSCIGDNGKTLLLSDAINIAKSSECGDDLVVECDCPDGYKKDGEACNPDCYYSTPKCLMPSKQCEKTYWCNPETRTYWIDMNITKQGCNPACVISLDSNTAEINWMCTGAILP